MAANTLPFMIALEQNQNDESTAYGKYYGVAYSPQDTLSLRGLIERVAFEQSIYSRDVIEAVVTRLTKVMCELLQSGESVKWDGLGTFQPRVESKGVSAPEDFDPSQHIIGVHIRFIPEGQKGESLTSRKFRDMCTLQLAGVWVKENYELDGQKKVLRTFYSMEEWANRNLPDA